MIVRNGAFYKLYEYYYFLFLNANNTNPNVRKFVREKLEKSYNPKGSSIKKRELEKYFNK
jgi:hypothetical protein